MSLSPEERQRIYEEEKARIEARERIEKEKQQTTGDTSTGLAPNAASLLCYLGWWITGIIFLVLEQKNKWVRFHAAQSLVVFGAFTVAMTILGWIPIFGQAFAGILWIVAFILWIILMVKANQGIRFKLLWAGDAAERIVGWTSTDNEHSNPNPSAPVAEPLAEASQPQAKDLGQQISERIDDYFKRKRTGRIAESSFIIAWSIILLIIFNFFNQYIAYYSPKTADGVTIWTAHPFFTQNINLWLPILNLMLALTIIGHVILIIFDRYALREVIKIILDGFGLATVLTLFSVFPFNFRVIPNTTAAYATDIGLRIALVIISIGLGIGIIARLIKLIVNIARQSPQY